MLTLAASDVLAGSATSATTVNYVIFGDANNGSDAYGVLASGQLASSAATIYTVPGSTVALIPSIALFNTGGTSQTVAIYRGGTASANQIWAGVIPPGGTAWYENGQGWTVYSASGLIVGVSGSPGGVGTPNTAAQSLTASSANMITGTLVALQTGQLFVGSRYRFELGMLKTAAGTATWTVTVKFGTNGTTSDSAIATWTSGTNTAAIDQATLAIEVVVTALGTSATAACLAMYVNSLTSVTGLGEIGAAPGSTATFNSTSSSPYLHIDITPGASAVMTAWGSAERLV